MAWRALTNVRPRAPPRARADPGGRPRAAPLEHRLRPAVRVLDRRGRRTSRAARSRCSGRTSTRATTRTPPRTRTWSTSVAGDVRPARLSVRPAVRQRHRPVRQEPDGDVDRRPRARRAAMHGGRRGHLLGRPAALGRARGTRGRGAARICVPPGGVLARGGHGRGGAARRGARARLRRSGPYEDGRIRFFARRAPRPAWRRFQVHGGPGAAAVGDRGARPAAGRRPSARSAGSRSARLAAASCSWRSTRTCSARSMHGGATFATRPRWPRTSRSRVRSQAASRITSTASPGDSAGPPRSRHCSAPRSNCDATSCAG